MTPKDNKNKSKSKTSASAPTETKPAVKKTASRPVGQILKKARLEKGFRLTQIVQQLNISQSYIQAIENGKINELPKEQTYAIGFVKAYAHAVDLNVQEIVDQFKQEFYGESDQYDLAENETEVEEAIAEENNDVPNSKVLWGSLGVAVLAIIVGYFISKSSLFSGESEVQEDMVAQQASVESAVEQEEPKPIPMDYPPAKEEPMAQSETPDETLAPTEQIQAIDKPTEKKEVTFVYEDSEQDKVVATNNPSESVLSIVESKEPAENDKKALDTTEDKGFVSDPSKLPILITVTEDTWVEIKDPENEDLYLSKVIKPGFIYQVPRKGLVFSTGNAGATIVTVGSKSLPSIGKYGQVLHDIYLGVAELKERYADNA